MKARDYLSKKWFLSSFAFLAAIALMVCDFYLPTSALARVQEKAEWSVPVLVPVVNSTSNEVLPHLSKDGLSLYFASNRPGSVGNFDIWVSQRETLDDDWDEPQNLGPNINTSFNDRAPDLSRDGHFLFFASNRPGGFGSPGGTLDIWVSYREHTHDDFGWQQPVNLGSGVNGTANDFGACYFENDDTGIPNLFFGSFRDNGDGGNDPDIYMSELQADGSFGPAVLITELSTQYSDFRPTIRPNGLEVFFGSNRPGSLEDALGIPSLDLWTSKRETVFAPWSTPVSVGPIVNTEFTENFPALSSDGATLIFTSNRPGGVGGDDLYMSSREKHD